MNKIDNVNENMWVLCHNLIDIFHIINLESGNKLESGQPYLEKFETEDDLNLRIN